MIFYIFRRILLMIPTLLIISALVFTLIELPPGDYFESHMAELEAQGENIDRQQIEELKQEYGFDRHPVERYFVWLAGLVQGDLGYSFEYELPVSEVGIAIHFFEAWHVFPPVSKNWKNVLCPFGL